MYFTSTVFFFFCTTTSFFLHNAYTGGACETTDDCVAPNVCSKWGWCQWTKIYGEDGPSQGANAEGAGRSGQCVTSADCASRVPYCSKLGYCHGGRLPFDEAQLEITVCNFQTGSAEEAQWAKITVTRRDKALFPSKAKINVSLKNFSSLRVFFGHPPIEKKFKKRWF